MKGTDDALTALERAVLDVASAARPPSEARIRELLDLSPTRYHQVLNGVVDRPAALRYAPATVHRLLRLRDRRRGDRPA